MKADWKEVSQLLDKLPADLQHPMYRPEYINIMSANTPNSQAYFFLYREDDAFFYHPFILTESLVAGEKVLDAESVYGFGGAIYSTEDKAFLNRAYMAHDVFMTELGVSVEFIRFNPLLKNFAYYDGEIEFNRKVVTVDISKDNFLSGIQSRTRSAIRKSIRQGVTVSHTKLNKDIQSFVQLYYETMKRLNAEGFYFFKEETLTQLINLPTCKLITASYDGKLIAAATFFCGGGCMEYHLSASNELGMKLNATKVIIVEAMALGNDIGCKTLHLGGGLSNEDNDSLFSFKSLFSGDSSEYFIGKKIYKSEFYQKLKTEYVKLGLIHASNNKLIFYR